jgi:tetratricopeptide (TPR) repeat protein
LLAVARLSVAASATALIVTAALAVPASGAISTSSELQGLTDRIEEQDKRLTTVEDDNHDLRRDTTWVLAPIAILVGMLALGGGFGVLFSVRDERRTSQLHELSVASEVSSQRRTEQTYASFLEQSQTTLSLVNDTLQLAKEATDRAAHTMELKAKARVESIEGRAQGLMLQVFGVGEFEAVVNHSPFRTELHSIADDLRNLEGYLSLQDIALPPYTTFVKAIDQFLLDDTDSALKALREASQGRKVGDLQRFTLYWIGYLLTTVGEYDEALRMFRDDEVALEEHDREYLQLERIVAETEFFKRAKALSARPLSTDPVQDPSHPRTRFNEVADLLDKMAKLAVDVEDSDHHRHDSHLSHEVARGRADVWTWIAYDARRVDDPLRDAVAAGDKAFEASGLVGQPDAPDQPVVRAADFMGSALWAEFNEPDIWRAWALHQAKAICEREDDRDFYVTFALAECEYMLDEQGADASFVRAEQKLAEEVGTLREKRRVAEFEESALICHSRLLALRREDEDKRDAETRQVHQAFRRAREAVQGMRQGRVTVFSQLQRRNLAQKEFERELTGIRDQDRLDEFVN